MQSLQLGVVGNLQISSLIDARGRHVWTCWPRPDADPIFCSLLAGGEADVAGGFYDVVRDRFVRAEQAYVHPFCARPCTTNAAQCGSTTSLRTSYSLTDVRGFAFRRSCTSFHASTRADLRRCTVARHCRALHCQPISLPGLRTSRGALVEVDHDDSIPLWRIVTGGMKTRREHVVPLPRQAVAILKELQLFTGTEGLIFLAFAMRDDLSRELASSSAAPDGLYQR